ncbi:MAG: hypothetical protein COU65_00485 [Candidatus Pacebacteria bacterium CG10_big_fil_rev_8_21_14_0_10_42_12]|nr:MAG: hypothetical protein COU65_00485 [Candidatus Pacebacteria bacterium CG10_big_fil_rev_8_21_14_0_10_42_12]
MRSQVIPAQITTVEDKIAGNFSLTQIILLLVPALLASFIYVILPPTMVFVWYKLLIATVFGLLSISLAIRIKGRIIASWLSVIFHYNLRAKYYIYNKNSLSHREVTKPEPLIIKDEKQDTEVVKERKIIVPNLRDVLQLNYLLATSDFDLTYRTSKKGGLNVAFEKVSK